MRRWLWLVVALSAMVVAALDAQRAEAARVRGEPPVVDGALDDEAWRLATPIRDFVQRNPDEGAAPSESTEVRFVYTDHDLYVAFRGYDRRPDQIAGRLVRRDQRVAADYFNLFLDTFNDGRSAFEIAVNPSGARRDVFIYDDGRGRDESWDPVYDWATRTDSLGWTVELRIPFSQLRFTGRDSVVFGLRLRRGINRRNEEVNWPFFPRDQAGEVSRYGKLVGLAGLTGARRVELVPYTAGSAAFEPAQIGNPFATGQRTALRAGADLKLGVTSGLTLDLTVNPDFGQVEADPAVVNLTAFESFFPEKRPFFVEGVNLFQFGLQPGEQTPFGGRSSQEKLVYTRRIGRAPQIAPDANGGYAEPVAQTTILGAAKLSGQLGGGWSVGATQGVTAQERAAVIDGTGGSGRVPVEPLTGYSVLRVQRTVRGGRLAYGAIATGTARRLDADVFTRLHARAYSGGLDFGGWIGEQIQVEGALMGSRAEGAPEALARTQLSSARYFQRPDQGYVTLDSTRTSLDGAAGFARFAKVAGFLTWDMRYATRTPGFEVNDLGFQRHADSHEQRAEVALRWLEPGRVFRQFEWQAQQRAEFTYGGERTRLSVEGSASAEFLNYWNLNTAVERRLPSLNVRMLRGGPAFLEPGAWDLRVNGRTDFRRSLWANGRVSHSVEDESGVRSLRLNGGIRFRPPGGFSVSLDANADWQTDDRQYIEARTFRDSTYYLFGRLERRELSLTLRADLALTPRLSLELYAQPFVSAGRYQELKRAADPRAPRYADRLIVLGPDQLSRPGGGEPVAIDINRDGTADFAVEEPDFRVVSLRTNAVLRWEFLPGSTFFVVWQQSRRERSNKGALTLPGDVAETFGAPGSHVFAVKVAYWIG